MERTKASVRGPHVWLLVMLLCVSSPTPFPTEVMLHNRKSRASGGNSLKPAAGSPAEPVIPLEQPQSYVFK